MYRLTDRRREKAQHIFAEYGKQLRERGGFDTRAFEHELRDCWGVGYREIKGIVIDMHKRHRGELGRIAEYYMRHQAPEGTMVLEFKRALGISEYAQRA